MACPVIAGSLYGVFCAFSLAQGGVVQLWRAPRGLRLMELQFLEPGGALWTLESDGEYMYVARYVGPWQWVQPSTSQPCDDEGGRSCFRLMTQRAAMRLTTDPPRLIVSLDDGRIDIYDASSDQRLPVKPLERVRVSTVLGISGTGLFFSHVALWGSLLVVSLPTDVWLIQLGLHLPLTVQGGGDGATTTPPVPSKTTAARRPRLLGTIQDDANMLDVAIPKASTCVMISSSSSSSVTAPAMAGGREGFDDEEDEDCLAGGILAAHLRFSARWAVVDVDLLPPPPPPPLETCQQPSDSGHGRIASPRLLVVAGKAAQFYDIHRDGGGGGLLASISLRSQINFNSQVLYTSLSESCEYPWLFVLTLSGLEVWSLPSPPPASSSSSGSNSLLPPLSTDPCRILVQRLEFHGQLDRLPPLAMKASHGTLLLVPNPPGYTPQSLSFMLYHTMPRPSPHDAVPELPRPPATARASGQDHQAGDDDAEDLCKVSPGTILVLHLSTLATVFRAIRQEVIKEVMPNRPPRQGEEEEEEEESFRFLFAVEYLDSTVVPPPEAVAYESGVELLKSMYVLLRRASVLPSDGVGTQRGLAKGEGLEGALQQTRMVESRRLYICLACQCASLLGEVLLEPQAQGVARDLRAACEWFGRSDTAVQTVCEKLTELPGMGSGDGGGLALGRGTGLAVTVALVDYLDAALAVVQAGTSSGGGRPPLVRKEASREEQEELWRRVVKVYASQGFPRLLALITQSRLPWLRAKQARKLAKDAVEGFDAEDVEARGLGLLMLHVYEVAAVMEDKRSTRHVDKENGAWMELTPGHEGHMQAFMSLSATLQDHAVALACLRAPQAVVKCVHVQGASLVVRGPLFGHLESERPTVLAQVLAEATSRKPRPLEITQVLRLLGPYGTLLSNELQQQQPAGTSQRPPEAGIESADDETMTRSRMSVRDFLEAKLEPMMTENTGGNRQSGSGFDGRSVRTPASSGRAVWSKSRSSVRLRSLLLAELVGLYLDELSQGWTTPSSTEESPRGTAPGGWLVSLAALVGFGSSPLSASRLESVLLPWMLDGQQRALFDWDLVMRLASSRGDGVKGGVRGGGDGFWTKTTRIACLASLGRIEEAWDLLLETVKDVMAIADAKASSASSVLLDFGSRYCGADGRKWGLLISRLQEAATSDKAFQDVHKLVTTELAERLPAQEYLTSLHDGGDLTGLLPSLLGVIQS